MKYGYLRRAAGVRKSPPSRGAWIEIDRCISGCACGPGSPPSRGAWIEMPGIRPMYHSIAVAPLAGGVD